MDLIFLKGVIIMNDICRLLDLRYPIIQGGMGNISNAELASAVSEAGGAWNDRSRNDDAR